MNNIDVWPWDDAEMRSEALVLENRYAHYLVERRGLAFPTEWLFRDHSEAFWRYVNEWGDGNTLVMDSDQGYTRTYHGRLSNE